MGVDGANEGASSGQEGAWNAPAGACVFQHALLSVELPTLRLVWEVREV